MSVLTALATAAAAMRCGAEFPGGVPPSPRSLALSDVPSETLREGENASFDERLRLLGTLGRMGVSALFSEDASTGEWIRKPSTDGVHTLSVSSENMGWFGRVVRDGAAAGHDPAPAVARSTLDWSEETGSFTLRRVELGLFGKRLWLARELGGEEAWGRGVVFLRFEW